MALDDIKLPANEKLAGKMLEGHMRHEQTRIERGFIGSVIGSSSSVPYNIAAVLAVVAAIALISVIVMWSGNQDFTRKDGVASLSALVTLLIGYLFGRGNK